MMNELKVSKDLLDILAAGREYKLAKGQIIQSTEDRKVFSLLSAGYVKRYLIANDGSLGVQVVYGPGDIFPITLALNVLIGLNINESPEVYYYEAITDVELHTVDQDTLKTAVAKNPELYRDLMLITGIRLHTTLKGLENLTLKNSYKRVAHQLAYLARRFGEQKQDTIRIAIPLTHQDLADILSLTRETVSTSIIKLRQNGLVKTGKNIVVPDIVKLEEEAYS